MASSTYSECPYAKEIEQEWIKNFPPGHNVTAQAYYDPHFIGFNNQNYDSQPDGDVILFKNASMKFEIDGLHKLINRTYRPSVIDTFVVEVKSQTIEYGVNSRNLIVDGTAPAFMNNWAFLEKSATTIVMDSGSKFHIYTDFGARLTVYNCGQFNLNITLTLPRMHAENAEPSLFGNLSGGHAQIVRGKGLFRSH